MVGQQFFSSGSKSYFVFDGMFFCGYKSFLLVHLNFAECNNWRQTMVSEDPTITVRAWMQDVHCELDDGGEVSSDDVLFVMTTCPEQMRYAFLAALTIQDRQRWLVIHSWNNNGSNPLFAPSLLKLICSYLGVGSIKPI